MDRVRVTERSSKVIEFDILDSESEPVPAASLDSATLTLWDVETGVLGASPQTGILNDRSSQDVLNDNNVTIDTDGHVVWTLQPEDNVIVTPKRQVERHRAMFTFTWATGSFNYELELEVVNLRIAN